VDWEVELAVVIGKRGTYIEREDALEYVAGYALHNDYSERSFNSSGADNGSRERVRIRLRHWGRSWHHLTRFPDTSRLGMWLKVNGVSRQNSSTSEMIFDDAALVSYVSQFMTLLPGDVVAPERRLGLDWA
jgi:2,4-diketo-3-deoxy-L-fuconate hydrolase